LIVSEPGRPKIGLVGLGQQACRRHLPALADLGLAPVAVYDPSPAARDRFFDEWRKLEIDAETPHAAGSLADLADRVDAADVVIPPGVQPDVFSELIRRQKPFICEKPFCRSWPEARHVAALAEKNLVAGAYLENWIFDPIVWFIQAVIAQGRIGLLQRCAITFPNAGLALYPDQSPWRAEAGQGGALLDWASHGVGLAWFMAGPEAEIVSAQAVDVRTAQQRVLVSGVYREQTVEDTARFELVFRTGQGGWLTVNVDGSWGQPWMWSPGHAYRVLSADGFEGRASVKVTNTDEGRRYRLSIDREDSRIEDVDLGLLKRYDPTASALNNAVQGLQSQGVPRPESDLDFGVRVQLALGMVRLSAADGRPITTERFEEWVGGFLARADSPMAAWDLALDDLRSRSER
jgi:predicted dehydrogenase